MSCKGCCVRSHPTDVSFWGPWHALPLYPLKFLGSSGGDLRSHLQTKGTQRTRGEGVVMTWRMWIAGKRTVWREKQSHLSTLDAFLAIQFLWGYCPLLLGTSTCPLEAEIRERAAGSWPSGPLWPISWVFLPPPRPDLLICRLLICVLALKSVLPLLLALSFPTSCFYFLYVPWK